MFLPPTAYRKTYFVALLQKRFGAWRFDELLNELAPQAYARLREHTPHMCLIALARHINANLFPLHPGALAEMEENPEMADAWAGCGIPIYVCGVDWYDDPPDSNAAALCYRMGNGEGEDFDLKQFAGLDEIIRRGKVKFNTRLPRGRTWCAPWDALWDMFYWANGETGYRYLDYNDQMLEEGELPPWNLNEIEDLAMDWTRTKPIWERIQKLGTYVDARPHERLPILARALQGDGATIRQITEPKHRKTLAEMFK